MQTHDKQTPWKNFLVVLKGNVEDRVKKTKGSSQKKEKPPTVPEPQSDPAKTQEVITVSGEPVTISGDWAGSGAIALVSHSALGGLTVIQTEVPAGTQLQPIVTADGTVISLDTSAVSIPVTVPFNIPISLAHSITVSPSISVAGQGSDAILAPVVSTATVEEGTTESVLSAAAVPLSASDECITVQAVEMEEAHDADGQQGGAEDAQTADGSNSMETGE